MERRMNLLEVVRCVTVVSFLVTLAMITMTIIDHGSPRLMTASVISLAIMVITMTYWMVCNDAQKKSGGESPIQPPAPPKPLTPENFAMIQGINEIPGGPMAL